MSDLDTRPARLLAPDALRGLAAILMVQQHLGAWLFDLSSGRHNVPFGWKLVNATGGAAAPLFVLLAGFGITLSTHVTSGALARRGLVLMGFGVALNLLTPSWLGPFSFYILHFLGAVLVLAPALRRLGDRSLLAVALGALVLSVVARGLLDTPLVLTNPALRDASGTLGPLRLALVEGQFPLFPWLAFALLGIWAARRRAEPQLIFGAALVCGVLALLLRFPVFFAPALARRLPWSLVVRFSFYPASPVFVCALLGVTLALLALLLWLERGGKLGLMRPLLPFGRTSLTLLFVHVVLVREGCERLGLLHGLGVAGTLATIILFLGGWWLLARLWSRLDYRFGLEWCLRRAG